MKSKWTKNPKSREQTHKVKSPVTEDKIPLRRDIIKVDILEVTTVSNRKTFNSMQNYTVQLL